MGKSFSAKSSFFFGRPSIKISFLFILFNQCRMWTLEHFFSWKSFRECYNVKYMKKAAKIRANYLIKFNFPNNCIDTRFKFGDSLGCFFMEFSYFFPAFLSLSSTDSIYCFVSVFMFHLPLNFCQIFFSS